MISLPTIRKNRVVYNNILLSPEELMVAWGQNVIYTYRSQGFMTLPHNYIILPNQNLND